MFVHAVLSRRAAGWRLPLLGAVALLCRLSLPAAAEPPLRIMYFERPPYASLDPGRESGGLVRGLTADPVRQALEKAGLAATWEEVPSKRQMEIIRTNAETACGLGWFRTPEREAFARFSAPLYEDRPMVLLVRREETRLRPGMTIEEALSVRGASILVKEGFSYGPVLDAAIATRRPVLVSTLGENVDMLRMLQARRADMLFIAPEEAEHLLHGGFLPAEAFQMLPLADMPPGNMRHLMCANATPEALLRRLDEALASPGR